MTRCWWHRGRKRWRTQGSNGLRSASGWPWVSACGVAMPYRQHPAARTIAPSIRWPSPLHCHDPLEGSIHPLLMAMLVLGGVLIEENGVNTRIALASLYLRNPPPPKRGSRWTHWVLSLRCCCWLPCPARCGPAVRLREGPWGFTNKSV